MRYILSFSEIRQRLFLSRKEFFFVPGFRFYGLCSSNQQEAVHRIIKHCGLEEASVHIVNKRLDSVVALQCIKGDVTTIPGLTYILSPRQFTVFLEKEYNTRIRGAVLAHEISHIYASVNRLQFKTKSGRRHEFNEQMTDLLSIALGLGPLMLRGNDYSYTKGETVYFGTLGYIKPRLLRYAQDYMEYIMLHDVDALPFKIHMVEVVEI